VRGPRIVDVFGGQVNPTFFRMRGEQERERSTRLIARENKLVMGGLTNALNLRSNQGLEFLENVM
jgi:hypothetical protein